MRSYKLGGKKFGFAVSKYSKKKLKNRLYVANRGSNEHPMQNPHPNRVRIDIGQWNPNGEKLLFFNGLLVLDQEDALALVDFIQRKLGVK